MADSVKQSKRGPGRPPKAASHPVDVHVGARVRLRRTMLDMSQATLGEFLGLTFQQVQKYERGSNRISASKLYKLSEILDVPVSFFFDDAPEVEVPNQEPPVGSQEADPGDLWTDAEMRGFVEAYYRLTDDAVRKRIFELTKSLAAHYLAGIDEPDEEDADTDEAIEDEEDVDEDGFVRGSWSR